jgi:hypothetical protein
MPALQVPEQQSLSAEPVTQSLPAGVQHLQHRSRRVRPPARIACMAAVTNTAASQPNLRKAFKQVCRCSMIDHGQVTATYLPAVHCAPLAQQSDAAEQPLLPMPMHCSCDGTEEGYLTPSMRFPAM